MSLTVNEFDPTTNTFSTPIVVQVVSPGGNTYARTELFYAVPTFISQSLVIPVNTTSNLHVSGSGFDVNGSAFYFIGAPFGTQPVSVTISNANQAVVSIPYPFTTTPGTYTLKIVNPSSHYTTGSPGGGTATVPVTVS